VTDSNWTALAAIGQLAAAAAALIGLIFVGLEVRATRKTSDFHNLLEFDRRAAEREHALLRAENEATKKQAFFEFMNFLETHAAALNAKLLPRKSRQLVREKLVDSIAVITEEPSWHQTIVDGITSPTAFAELRKFMGREKRAIDNLVKARAAAKA
jgi:hypothetical protein